jgi:anti-anti-sigma factor
MKLRVAQEDKNFVHLALTGSLDAAGVEAVAATFAAYTSARRKPVLVDLSEVTVITSTGLRMLLTAAKVLGLYGAKVVLLKPQPTVEETLRLTSFHNLMPIEQDLTKALALLHSA